MSQLVTISKSDDQFWPMLTGRFSKTHFAQPVKNLYVNSDDETVTFKIIKKNKLSLLAALTQWYSLARNIYLVFPILGGISYLMFAYGVGSVDLIISSFLGLLFSFRFVLVTAAIVGAEEEAVPKVVVVVVFV